VIAAQQKGGADLSKKVTEKPPAAAGVPNPPCADIKPM
jgi:hypothetical protein